MRTICPKCDDTMLPVFRGYTVGVHECLGCGCEVLVNKDGEIVRDYQEAWQELTEWIQAEQKELENKDLSLFTFRGKQCAFKEIKEKMAEILKERE